MATIPEQLEALPLRDSFNRANENPMAVAGWTKLPWCVATGKIASGTKWTPTTGFVTGEDGAYWNSAEVSNPAIKAGELTSNTPVERWIALWVAVDPETHNGYRLRLVAEEQGVNKKHEWRLERVTGGEVTLLESGSIATPEKDLFALTAAEGEVKAWRLVDGEGAWIELGAVADATYNKGYVGIEGRGFDAHYWDAAYSGELEAEEGGGEEVVVESPPASATASTPSPVVAVVAAPDAATATASCPSIEVATGPMSSPTNNYKGLPLPHPSILANPARLGPPRFTALDRKVLGLD